MITFSITPVDKHHRFNGLLHCLKKEYFVYFNGKTSQNDHVRKINKHVIC